MLLFLSESPGGHAISGQKRRIPFGLPIKTKPQEDLIHDAHKKQPGEQIFSTSSVKFCFLILFSNNESVLQFLIVNDNVA